MNISEAFKQPMPVFFIPNLSMSIIGGELVKGIHSQKVKKGQFLAKRLRFSMVVAH